MPDHRIFNERPESQDRALKVIEKLGYTFISRGEAEKKRGILSNVLFRDEIEKYLSKQTYKYSDTDRFFSGSSVSAAIHALEIRNIPDLYSANKTVHELICSGKSMEEVLPNGTRQSFDIGYVDFEHPENNILQVTDEFEVERSNGKFARPDIVVMINGIPTVVIECKRSGVDVMEGVNQNIRNWGSDYIPQLFQYTQLVLAVNPDKVLYGTCGTHAKHFVSWYEDDKEWHNEWCRKCSPDGEIKEQDKALVSLLHPERLLDLIKNYIIYDNNVKKVARYKQFFAVKKCMDRILLRDNVGIRNGVVWHTQGSGKTITMLMLTKMLLQESIKQNSIIKRPRFIMVTDRVNLDKQIRDNFINAQMNPNRAKTGKALIELLKEDKNTVITAIVNKFEAAMKQEYNNDSENIFVFIDEGHRTQYGKLNLYMNKVLPNAVKIAFTGTPLISNPKKTGIIPQRDTFKKFGELIDSYTFKDAIEDKVTVPILYEGRVIPQKVTSKQINEHLKYITVGLSENERTDLEKKYSRYVALSQTEQRLRMVAFDLYSHFISYVKPKGFKAMLTCSSRAAAVEMFYLLKNFDGINPAVVITPNLAKEGEEEINTPETKKIIGDFFAKEVDPLYKNNYDVYEDYITREFSEADGEIDLLIVQNKLLTGFDAPPAAVLYVDKKLQEHTLLQAIARVNRVFENKEFGLIVDYQGIFKKLNEALDLYTDNISRMDEFDKHEIEDAIISISEQKSKLEKLYNSLWNIFKGINHEDKRQNIWQERLSDNNLRNNFYETLSSYAKYVDLLFSSCEFFDSVGTKQAEKYRNDYIFFEKLKDSVTLRFNDRVDFSKYEDGIRQLLNTYVTAEDAKIHIEPLDILNKEKMEEQMAILGSKEAKADAIRTRQVEILEGERYDDPIKYLSFMERINKTISDYMEGRNNEKYLASMEDIADDYRNGYSNVTYPQNIAHNSEAKSFYGSVCSGLKKSLGSADGYENESTGFLALQIKEIVSQNAKRDWRENVIVHRNIKKMLDDALFDYMEDNGLDWSFDTIDIIIDEIMMTAKRIY